MTYLNICKICQKFNMFFSSPTKEDVFSAIVPQCATNIFLCCLVHMLQSVECPKPIVPNC